MAVTQITSQVIASNAVVGAKIANNAIETRHINIAAITADKFGANVYAEAAFSIALQANIDLVQDNVSAVGAVVPVYTTNSTSGTSNVFSLGNAPTSIDYIVVALNGIVQIPTTDFIHVTGNNSIQFTDASVPSGLNLVVSAWE